MAHHTKERLEEILQHKIDFHNDKYNNFIINGISIKKLNKMAMLRDQYITAKAELEAS